MVTIHSQYSIRFSGLISAMAIDNIKMNKTHTCPHKVYDWLTHDVYGAAKTGSRVEGTLVRMEQVH